MKKKMALFPALALAAALALAGTALAAQHTDSQGNTWNTDEANYYALEAPARPALMAADGETALTPLGDPSNLRWDTDTPGETLWETEGAFQMKLEIIYYRTDNPDEPVTRTIHFYNGSTEIHQFSDNHFYYFTGEGWNNTDLQSPLSSGDYYFTVQNLGDGITYGDSAVISSLDLPGGVYHYVEPAMDTTLETPPQGRWEWPASVWDDRQETDERIRTYFIEYGYSAEKPEDLSALSPVGGSFFSTSGQEDFWLQDRLIGENGAGWYYFRVRAISADVEQWRNGAFSPWSGGYNLLEASQKITESLNAIDKNAQPADIRQQVQALNKTELKNAMTADIQGAGTGALDVLTALERAVGSPASANVAQEMAERFDVNGVSVVGAALNNLTGAESPVLNIGAPKEENHVRNELYSSTVAVDFSMDLSGVHQPHELAVPVKVTLPIPAGVNPEFLVILHYHAYGGFEEVVHNVFQGENGQWYVSFVLSSFSDFTITELAASIKTEPDGRYETAGVPDGARLYLARYEGGRMTSFEELKELSGTLTGNGAKKLFLLDGQFQPLCKSATV